VQGEHRAAAINLTETPRSVCEVLHTHRAQSNRTRSDHQGAVVDKL
jgi:hypothetical protein